MLVTPNTDFSNISWNWHCNQRAFSAIYQNYFWKLTLQISSPSRENCQTQFLRENWFWHLPNDKKGPRHPRQNFPLELHREHLEHVLQHSIGIHIFNIPYSNLHVSSHELDFLFTTQLSRANLYFLDITVCRLSTLCFLKSFKHLKNLHISECPN